MNYLLDFLLLKDPNVRWVLISVLLMCSSSAIIGCFTFLRKRALVGDAISHAILPGICLSFMFTQSKNPFFLLIGAFVSGWIGLYVIDFITRNSKIKTDAALGLVLSVFYGFGILLLTTIQNAGSAAQSGLDKYLFGNAAAMMLSDIKIFGLFSLVLLAIVYYFYDAFKLVTFDRNFAEAKGFPVKRIESLISILTVFAIAIGIQAVGVVLMAALLITPAAAARYWTFDLKKMILLSAVFAMLAGLSGTFISYTLPKMPTGPWIVTVLSFLALFSILSGRKKGVWAKWRKRKFIEKKMLKENILKCMYHLGESSSNFYQLWSFAEMKDKRYLPSSQLRYGIKKLEKEGLVSVKGNAARLTEKGFEEGKRITRIHRLWEIYLTKHMQLPADHVHDDAEAIEHLITPALEKELEHQLEYPLIDPHDSPIPYKK
ncbi:MAG: iron chelate uptake ABC transporter family permease subunit [Bacteroidota bacterium]